jgi:hypothetical protein
MKKQTQNQEIWFPAKKHGFGWGIPVTWKGWVVLLVYAFLMIIGALFLTRPSTPVIYFIGYTVLPSTILIFICWMKGEKK